MKIRLAACILCLSLFVLEKAQAQINPPKKHTLNLGLYTGLGGLNFTPIPGVDLQFKNTIVRIGPGYKVFGAGVTQEIKKISPVFYNGYWVVSAYYAKGEEESTSFAGDAKFDRFIGLTGVRFYFGSRFYSSFQGGAMVSKYAGHSEMDEVIPYFEFNIGINLFRNYLPKEEVAE